MSEAKVAALFTYPIKSCAGTRLASAEVTVTGLEYDRQFMLVDHEGNFISQRTEPSLAVVAPHISRPDGDGSFSLKVAAPGQEPLQLDYDAEAQSRRPLVEAYVHGRPVDGRDTPTEASEWFSDYLGREVRLLATDPSRFRLINNRYRRKGMPGKVGFADAFPMLLTAAASLHRLQNAMREMELPGVGMDRFRPNVVVAGPRLEAFEEDYWRHVTVGQMIAHVVRPCKRCATIDVDQSTGQRTGKNVRKGLKAAGRFGQDLTDPGEKPGYFFGQNVAALYERGTRVREGDEVVVYVRSSRRNVELEEKLQPVK